MEPDQTWLLNLLSWNRNFVFRGLKPLSWVPFPLAIIIILPKVKKSIGQKEKLFIEYIFGKQGAADTAYAVQVQFCLVAEDKFFESRIYLFDGAA